MKLPPPPCARSRPRAFCPPQNSQEYARLLEAVAEQQSTVQELRMMLEATAAAAEQQTQPPAP